MCLKRHVVNSFSVIWIRDWYNDELRPRKDTQAPQILVEIYMCRDWTEFNMPRQDIRICIKNSVVVYM